VSASLFIIQIIIKSRNLIAQYMNGLSFCAEGIYEWGVFFKSQLHFLTHFNKSDLYG